jgi:multidrug efflux pump subunit AcrA (membrane-fusion protein)
MPATIVLDAYPNMSFPGRVSSISAVAQESSRTSLRRAFRVIVALDRLDFARMRPGLSSRVVIRAMTQPNALLVPRAAIDFSGAKPRAYLAGGKAVDVVLGACNAQECVVKSGLNEGETLGRVVASLETPGKSKAPSSAFGTSSPAEKRGGEGLSMESYA